MSTKWVVTTAAERIVLNDTRQGETTFTVTNPGTRADRAVFEAVPGDGADPSWFTVAEPQRRVAPAASVSYLLRTQIPDGTPPGQYEVKGRVYSADSAPEESSVLSGRIVFEVAAPPVAEKKKIPWWIIAVAAALVVVTIVTVVLVTTLGGGETPQAASSPPPSPAASGPITVPDLAKLNEANASFALTRAGLAVGTVKHKQDPGRPDQVIEQSAPTGTVLAKGSKVNLVVTVALKPPTLKTAQNAQIKIIDGKLEWDQTEPYVSRWLVNVSPMLCTAPPPLTIGGNGCNPAATIQARIDTRSYLPPFHPVSFVNGATRIDITPQFQWNVAAIDDFGQLGPYSPVLAGTMVN